MDFPSLQQSDDRTTTHLITSSSLSTPAAQLSQLADAMRMNQDNTTQQWASQNGLDEMAFANGTVFQPLDSTDPLASIVSSQAQQTNLLPTSELTIPQQQTTTRTNKMDEKSTSNNIQQADRLRMERGFNGLAYAEECKEKAREEYKEMKRKEHVANGQFDRLKRRRKNDSSMTTDQKYRRRLQMNQDSAAAARYAQDIYVRSLEKLVQENEVRLDNLQQVIQGMQRMERERESLIRELITRNRQVENALQQTRDGVQESQQEIENLNVTWKKNIPHPAWVSTMAAPETMSAQANDSEMAAGNVGVCPAPAV